MGMATLRGAIKMKSIATFVLLVMFTAMVASAAPPKKSRFYDFGDQMIDGEIRKPTALYTDAREKAKFNRLLKLKKSFLPQLYNTSKMKVFK